MQIKCPKCSWKPENCSQWNCEECGFSFPLFERGGQCPDCGFNHPIVYCKELEGGCGEYSPILDWYPGIDDKLSELNIEKLSD